jgi:hypothetical protein
MPHVRSSGFYWVVRQDVGFVVAEFSRGRWFFAGENEGIDGAEIRVCSEKLVYGGLSVLKELEMPLSPCDHGVTFDVEAARKLFETGIDTRVTNALGQVVGGMFGVIRKATAADIRYRWPRLDGPCPKGCGFSGIAYASQTHYVYGDW